MTPLDVELLRLLADMPFLDRLEAFAISGRSTGGVYKAVHRLEDEGLAAPVPHATDLTSPTRRFHLTSAGLRCLAQEEGVPVDRILRTKPVSAWWRRLLLERLDAAAVIYRIAAAVANVHLPIRFRWYRAMPMDAAIALPGGRTIAIVREGHTGRQVELRQAGLAAHGGPAIRRRPPHRPRRDPPAPRPPSVDKSEGHRGPRHRRRRGRGWHRRPGVAVALRQRRRQPAGRHRPHEARGERSPRKGPWLGPPCRRTSASTGAGGASPITCCPPSSSPPRSEPSTSSPTGPGSPSTTWPGCWASSATGPTRSPPPCRGSASSPASLREDAASPSPDEGLAMLARRDRAAVGGARKRWSAEPKDAGDWRSVSGRRSRQLLRNMEHTAAVHCFVAALATQARELGWETDQLDPPRRASRYFRYFGGMRSVHPDAFGILRREGVVRPFFLEWERRAVRPATMADRLAPYLRYYSSTRPIDDHGAQPSVLVVFDDDIAQTHFRRVAREEMERLGVTVPLLVSHKALLEQTGPLARAWLAPSGFEPLSPIAGA